MGNFLFKSFSAPAEFSDGGLLVGESHKEGGIKGVNTSTHEPIEVEGGEVIIKKESVKKKGVKVRKGTNKKILSDINEETGGVPIMKKGGSIPNNYKGKSNSKIWDSWTVKQREHFLHDHISMYDRDRDAKLSYKELEDGHYLDILLALRLHTKEGQYALGGIIVGNAIRVYYKHKKNKKAKGGEAGKVVEVWLNDNKVFQGNDKQVEEYLKKYKEFKELQIKSMFGIPANEPMYKKDKGQSNEVKDRWTYTLNPKIEKDLIPKDTFEFRTVGGPVKTETIITPKELAKERIEEKEISKEHTDKMVKKDRKYSAKNKKSAKHLKHPKVKVAKGFRLKHGYGTVKGKKNKTYRKGGKTK